MANSSASVQFEYKNDIKLTHAITTYHLLSGISEYEVHSDHENKGIEAVLQTRVMLHRIKELHLRNLILKIWGMVKIKPEIHYFR